MTPSCNSDTSGIVTTLWSRLVIGWQALAGNRRGTAEVEGLDPQATGEIARDLGVNRTELRALAGKWPDVPSDLLRRRMRLLHLDLETLRRNDPATARDVEKHCSLCGDRNRCRSDMDKGAVFGPRQEYCPNTHTLHALRRAQDKPSTSQG